MVAGLPQLNEQLANITRRVQESGTQRAVRAGIDILARAIRSEIDAEPDWSDDLKRNLKRTVGRGSRRTKFGAAGKAGFGVGQPVGPRRSGRNRGGVGVGSANAFWHIAGTLPRYVGLRTRRRRMGVAIRRTANALRYAGRLRPSACVSRAVSASADAVRDAMARELRRAINAD